MRASSGGRAAPPRWRAFSTTSCGATGSGCAGAKRSRNIGSSTIPPRCDTYMSEPKPIPPELISGEARLLQGIERPEGRDAELAREVARLNDAVREAARELGFDDQPGDFAALLAALREPEIEGRRSAIAPAGKPGGEPHDWSLAQAVEALRT